MLRGSLCCVKIKRSGTVQDVPYFILQRLVHGLPNSCVGFRWRIWNAENSCLVISHLYLVANEQYDIIEVYIKTQKHLILQIMNTFSSFVILMLSIFIAWKQFGPQSRVKDKLNTEYDYVIGKRSYPVCLARIWSIFIKSSPITIHFTWHEPVTKPRTFYSCV